MALFRRFFYRKPPDGLLEISERVYVFDCCFTTDVREDDEYKVYMGGIVAQLRDHLPDASFMVFNFREGDNQSQICNILSEYDMTVMDYPRHYESCPILTMEMIHHFLRSSESWLSLGQHNVLLMHCERGGWPVLAFMLAALLIYRKQYTGEQKTLDMIYKQAPRELLQFMSPLNPLPSQLRYLQYVSRRNVGSEWPPLDRALTLDCIILRIIPNFDGEGGCCPIFRIYGQDPFMAADRTPKVLFSTPKRSKVVRQYKQADCELVKIDIHCHIQGDVVLECISLDDDLVREEMMFRVMFNTAFIRSNILMLNREEIDILWDAKDQFPKDFRAEVLFSEMDAATSLITLELPTNIEEKEGLPIEAFAKVQEIFSNVDWLDPKADVALNVLQQITGSDIVPQKLETYFSKTAETTNIQKESSLENVKEKLNLEASENNIKGPASVAPGKQSSPTSKDGNSIGEKSDPHELHVILEQPVQTTNILQESFLENVKEKLNLEASENNIMSPTSVAPGKQPSPTTKDANSIRKKIDPQELHVALKRPTQSKIISQRVPQMARSTPVSYSNSLQGSPVPISRYHSAPSVLGITALLQDHDTSIAKDVNHAVTKSSSSPTTSASSDSNLCNLVQPSVVSNLSSSAPPPSLRSSGESLKTTERFSRTSLLPTTPPPPPPRAPASPQTPDQLVTSEVTQSTQHQGFPLELGIRSALSPPPLPPSLSPSKLYVPLTIKNHPPPPPPPPSYSSTLSPIVIKSSVSVPPAPPPRPRPPLSETSISSLMNKSSSMPPPPPPPQGIASVAPCSVSSPPPMKSTSMVVPAPPPPPPPARSIVASDPTVASMVVPSPPPPPPPARSIAATDPTVASSAPRPPPPPSIAAKDSSSKNLPHVPPVPPPQAPSAKGLSKAGGTSPELHSSGSNVNVPPTPAPPLIAKGRIQSRTSLRNQGQAKKTNLKPYHWLKLTRAMQGSLWAEAQKSDEASKAPEFDISELESLFSAAVPNSDHGSTGGKSNRRASGPKADKVQLIELRRAYNCEIMLTKVKVPLPDLMSSVLALDDSALDVDQVDNLIKFCPTKEEMELLKGYNGDKENLGKCEQFFLELMKVPRVESKLRVFSFKIQFHSQVSDLRSSLNIVNSASEEIRNSAKLKRIMQTILSLGNALNHGTARGSAIGFRLDSLLKLTDTRARNNKMTLMHYLCKVLAEKLPELLDFQKDLVSLEASTKIQLKYLAEEMQAISKGIEKVVQELTGSENDGPVSETFSKTLKEFLGFAEAEVRSLASLYSGVGRNADALALYFGEDPARCPFEQVVSTLLNFVRMFVRAHDENCKQLELEKKRAQKEAENEKMKMSSPKMESEKLSEFQKKKAHDKIKMATPKDSDRFIQTPIKSGNTN